MTSFPAEIVDIHVHIQPWSQLRSQVFPVLVRGRSPAEIEFLREIMDRPAQLLNLMDRDGITRVVLINYPSPDLMGFTEEANAFSLAYARHAPDRLIAAGSIHPRFTSNPRDAVRRWIERGLRLFKIHPVHQLIYPNAYLDGDPALLAIYEECQEAGIPVMIHTGTSVFPGARNKFGDPIYLDDVAVDFPRLRIIMAHGGRPLWMDTAFFLLRRFDNLYLDISSIPPHRLLTYFPRLEEVADRVVFGSDWPSPGVPGIRANAEAVWNLPLQERDRYKILAENYRKLWPDL